MALSDYAYKYLSWGFSVIQLGSMVTLFITLNPEPENPEP